MIAVILKKCLKFRAEFKTRSKPKTVQLAERVCLKQPSHAGQGSLGKLNIPPVPGRGFLTWQRQVPLWVALRLGQTAVLAAAVL